jgi:hypothetical protein
MTQRVFVEENTLELLTAAETEDAYAAVQALFDPALEGRIAGLQTLLGLDGHRRSPLVAALLANRVSESDLQLRGDIVGALVTVLQSQPDEPVPPPQVQLWLRHALTCWGEEQVGALLELGAADPGQYHQVLRVLGACPHGGEHVLHVLLDRGTELKVRACAARILGELGFLPAKAELAQFQRRIEARQADQMRMPFAARHDAEVEALLPAIHDAILALEEADD